MRIVKKWAIAQGYRHDNPAGDAIAAALPKRPVKVRHMPALPDREVPAAIAAVHASREWIGRSWRSSSRCSRRRGRRKSGSRRGTSSTWAR